MASGSKPKSFTSPSRWVTTSQYEQGISLKANGRPQTKNRDVKLWGLRWTLIHDTLTKSSHKENSWIREKINLIAGRTRSCNTDSRCSW